MSSRPPLPFAPDPDDSPSEKRRDGTRGELTEHKIERYYFKRILSGEIPPGTRFPSNRELATLWGTSCSTVQRALNQLEAAGLIDRLRRRGTFVRPKASRAFVGILFGPSLIRETASHYRLLNAALVEELDSEFLSCRTYDNFGTPQQAELDAALAHLRMDQRSFDFRGYVCITALPDTLTIDELLPPEMPRAMSDPFQPGNDVLFDINDFVHQSVSALHASGARRLCWIGHSKNELQSSTLFDLVSALQLLPPEVCVMDHPRQSCYEEATYHFVLSQIDRWMAARSLPDALIIPDDIAARGVLFALMSRGIRIPDQVQLAILGNEGADIFYPAPVIQYNYPIRAIGQHLAETLRKRMSGPPFVAPEPTVIKGALQTR